MGSTSCGTSENTRSSGRGGEPSAPTAAAGGEGPTGYSATSTRCPGGDRLTFHVTGAKFTQDGDFCGPGDGQELAVKVGDGGGGKFLVLETQRFALDGGQVPWLAEKLRWLLEGEEELF